MLGVLGVLGGSTPDSGASTSTCDGVRPGYTVSARVLTKPSVVKSVFAVVLLALVAPALADYNRTTLLMDTPTADVMPTGALAIAPIVTFSLVQSPRDPGWEGGASVRVAPMDGLEVALTAYTPKDYVLGLTYQLVSGQFDRVGLLQAFHVLDPWKTRQAVEAAQHWSLALGIYDIGIHSHVSPIGHDTVAWSDWQYYSDDGKYIRPIENFSAFVVTSIPITGSARISVGLGRGRFVGYDGVNDYLNTDLFFKGYHQWTIGLFGGLELYLTPQIALCAEANSRDANAGIKGLFGPVSVLVSVCKLEGLIHSGEERFGRLAVDVGWQFENLFGKD
jgi:hypothetical protein